jgi:quercetin dioxygenase-like cupin family protein
MLMATSRRLMLQGHHFPRHAHAGWSIALVERGTGYFRCAGVDYRAPAGAITVLHPGEAHDGHSDHRPTRKGDP